MKEHDSVNHPSHYTSHPSGIEVIVITQHENFCCGNAIKYILRRKHKNNEIKDLKKAIWYLNREVLRLENLSKRTVREEKPTITVLDNELSSEQERLQHKRETKS